MSERKGFGWYRLLTTAMFTIGIGGILYSLFLFVRHYRSDESDFETAETNLESDRTSFRATTPLVPKIPSNTLSDVRRSEDGNAWSDSVETKGLVDFESEEVRETLKEKPPERAPNEATGRRYAFGLSREEAHRRGAILKVELENLLYTCLDMEEEIVSGVAAASKIPDKAEKEREFERLRKLSDKQAALKMKILEMEPDYVALSEDYQGTQPGGWIYEIKQELHLGELVFGD